MATTLQSITASQRYIEIKTDDAGNDAAVQTRDGVLVLDKRTTSGTWNLPALDAGDLEHQGSLLTVLNPTNVDHTVEFGSPSSSVVVPAGKTAYLSAFNGQWFVG